MYRILITGPAQQDIQLAHDWWCENRSAADAGRWYRGIYHAIASLVDMPERFPHAPESELLEQGIRQLNFGLGRRPTHRIVFVMTEKEIVILRIRHASQDHLQFTDPSS